MRPSIYTLWEHEKRAAQDLFARLQRASPGEIAPLFDALRASVVAADDAFDDVVRAALADDHPVEVARSKQAAAALRTALASCAASFRARGRFYAALQEARARFDDAAAAHGALLDAGRAIFGDGRAAADAVRARRRDAAA